MLNPFWHEVVLFSDMIACQKNRMLIGWATITLCQNFCLVNMFCCVPPPPSSLYVQPRESPEGLSAALWGSLPLQVPLSSVWSHQPCVSYGRPQPALQRWARQHHQDHQQASVAHATSATSEHRHLIGLTNTIDLSCTFPQDVSDVTVRSTLCVGALDASAFHITLVCSD